MKPFKTLIVPVIIASLAITGVSAAQAKADNNDVAKFIVGAVAIAAIANALDNSKATDVSSQSYSGRVVDDRYRQDDRYAQPERRYRAAAAQCLETFRSSRGPRDLYLGTCLTQRTQGLGSPRKECKVRVELRNGRSTTAYDPRCLDRTGFWTKKNRSDSQYYAPQPRYDDRNSGHIVYGN